MSKVQTKITYPKDWKNYRLQDAVSFIDYGLSKAIPKIQNNNGVKIVSTADMTKDGRLVYSTIRRTEATERQINNLTLKDGDVLFNWRNSSDLIGKTAVFQEQDEPVIFASFILRIKSDEKISHNYYLLHLLNYFRYDGLFVQLSRRAVNQANYNRNEIYELPVCLPDYKEQKAIAKTLSTIQQAIQNQQALIDRTTELKKAMMNKLFTEGTKGEKQKETEIGLVPESWEVVRIDELFNIQQGKQVSKNNRVGNNQIPFLRTANVYWGNLELDKLDKMHFTENDEIKYKLQEGDLLTCEGGDVGRLTHLDINSPYVRI